MGKYTRYTLSDNKDNNFYLCSWMSLVNMLGNKCWHLQKTHRVMMMTMTTPMTNERSVPDDQLDRQ